MSSGEIPPPKAPVNALYYADSRAGLLGGEVSFGQWLQFINVILYTALFRVIIMGGLCHGSSVPPALKELHVLTFFARRPELNYRQNRRRPPSFFGDATWILQK